MSTDNLKARAEKRFWSKVDRGDNGECWLWTAGCFSNGYGSFYYEGRSQAASRVSWILHNGAIPDGLVVRHHCDVPACVNPSHLAVGTQQDNLDDCVRRGRQNRGVKVNRAKLTPPEVMDIYTSTRPHRTLAKDYGLTLMTVQCIRYGYTWNHVTGAPRKRRK